MNVFQYFDCLQLDDNASPYNQIESMRLRPADRDSGLSTRFSHSNGIFWAASSRQNAFLYVGSQEAGTECLVHGVAAVHRLFYVFLSLDHPAVKVLESFMSLLRVFELFEPSR